MRAGSAAPLRASLAVSAAGTGIRVERAPGARSPGPTLRVDVGAVAANVRTIARRISAAGTGAEIMAVVKADGFGHGMVPVARAALAAGATWLGVTDVAEGTALRVAGIGAPVLAWLHPAGIDVEAAAGSRIDLAVASSEELAEVAAAAARLRQRRRGPLRPLAVHLHVDAGMARGGAPRADWPALTRLAVTAEGRGLVRIRGLMGHLSDADQADPERNRHGIRAVAAAERMLRTAGIVPARVHLGATAATLTDPATHHDLVRIGAGLVGIDPAEANAAHPVALRGASWLTAPVAHTATVPAGTPVGYGGRHTTAGSTNLAVLGVGYADGIPRGLAPEAAVAIGGERFRIVGRVSMDQIVVDTRDRRFPRGTLATIWGPRGGAAPSIQDWARWADTIPHEIVTGIGPRVRRSLVHETADGRAVESGSRGTGSEGAGA
ncbi:alanine racemase [Microbacterium resistens]|uniref:Alanine racemase n=1 Tax=Microbacterium resistens TaxID=156977 RepID=A0ABY3RNN6_9MICO|nr:alanine racemase [Microbacterium resistens]UGS25548.1 alanine racemase [Microbacterium resistens]